MSRHYYFFEKLKIVEKQPCKLNCSYGKVSHTLKRYKDSMIGLKIKNYISKNFFYTKKSIRERESCVLKEISRMSF